MSTNVKIDFLVAGFSKCGTTTLCATLGKHPDIFIPVVKEPQYFSSTEFEAGHQRYDTLFAPATSMQKKGEGSPTYSAARREDVSIARIHDNNPDCRFVFIARDPRARIESSYREMHHSGVRFGLNAPYALDACLDEFPQMINDSLFFARIEKYLKVFGKESVRVVFLEDFNRNMRAELEGCCEHIGVDPARLPEMAETRLNSGTAKLYDTRVMRRLRSTRLAGPSIARLSPRTQDKFFAPLKLRRAFGRRPVHWNDTAIQSFQDRVIPDARRFLDLCNKPPDFWHFDWMND